MKCQIEKKKEKKREVISSTRKRGKGKEKPKEKQRVCLLQPCHLPLSVSPARIGWPYLSLCIITSITSLPSAFIIIYNKKI